MNSIKQSGISLLEILITTLILGIGLLGVAALQVSSVASNQEGFFTSQATSIAEDFSSRMRSAKLVSMIPSALDLNGEYVPSSTLVEMLAVYTVGGAFVCAEAPPQMCRNNGGADANQCSLANMAAFDRWEVCNAAKDTLPGGLVRMVTNGNRSTIVVDWDSASRREDIGTKENLNRNCSALTGSDERNCVIMEIIP